MLPATAFGSAFAINELGARAQGMGGAFASIADDASAIFFNPAGLAFLKGTHFEMHNLVVAGQFRFVPSVTPPGQQVPGKGYSGSIRQPFIPVANLYVSHRLNDKWAIGFGAYAPFGLAANWTNFNDGDPANTKYVGRFAGTRAKLLDFWLQPTAAYRINDSSAISVGVAYVHTYLLLEQSIGNPYDAPTDFSRDLAKDLFPGVDADLAARSFNRLQPEGRFRAAATSNKPAFSAGYLYKHRASGWQFGASWRSPLVRHLKGKGSFAFLDNSPLTPFLPKDRNLDVLFQNQEIAGTFTTPATYVLGVSRPLAGGRIAFDFRIQDFQRFKDLPLNFSITKDSQGRDLATSPESRLTFDFSNSYLLQAGYEKPLAPGTGPKMMQGMLANTTFRAGYVYDKSPVVDKSVGPLFPDANRHSFTAGMSKLVGNIELTLFYQFMQMRNRAVDVPANAHLFTNGSYNNLAHLAGASLRLHFGGGDRLD
ncbi:MAG: outer membrane protein transport protein [Bryobacteraceae bacterium]